jgi:ATP-binding cassette, subfamily B, bacterial
MVGNVYFYTGNYVIVLRDALCLSRFYKHGIQMQAKPTSDFLLFKRLVVDVKKFWCYIFGILFLDLLATPLSLLAPLPLKIVVDNVLGTEEIPGFLAILLPNFVQNSSMGMLIFAIVLLLFSTTLLLLQDLAATILRLHTDAKLTLDFRSRLFWHGQTLSLSYHDKKGVAHTLYRILYDANAGNRVIVDGALSMATAFITVVSMLVVIALINVELAFVAIAIVPILILLVITYRMPLRNGWNQQKTLDNNALSVISEVFSSLRVVKAYTQEQTEFGRYSQKALESFRSNIRVSTLEGTFWLAIGVVTACGTSAVLYIGVKTIQAGEMSVGDMLVVMSYLSLIYKPLQVIGKKLASMQSAFSSADRAFSFLDEDSDVPESPEALSLVRSLGEFRVSGITFGYDSNEPVLSDVKLIIPAGSKVGIVGKTGAGKTTFLNLLMRFYDPQSGQVYLDDTDIRDIKILDLRRQFGLVLQDPVLFSSSIKDNIAYGRPNASDEEVVAAAVAANAHEFVEQLPDGYRTLVGERGMRLSGGERQRIALARTFLRDAPILLLDEPTSSVDIGTEKLIMSAIARLMQGRTTFIIAHRLSTLEMCDMILHVNDGFITQIKQHNLEDFLLKEGQQIGQADLTLNA